MLRLTDVAWERVRSPVTATPSKPSDVLRAWTAAEVCFFYGQQDAAGLSSALEQNAVTGADLLSFTWWTDLCHDLRMTPFSARKVLRLQDAFLSGAVSMF